MLSIIVPCFNEEESIDLFYGETIKYIDDFEIIFVDDGSKDNTLEKIKNLCNEHDTVQYISFSRNFGKEAALYAGLKYSKGDYVAIMDVDLQDPPNLLPEMLETLQNGEYDIVATRRVNREGEPKIRSLFARLFYRLINGISDLELVDGERDYRLMTRQVANSLLELPEYNRFSKGLFNWIGFKTKWIEYENIERAHGESTWSFWGLVKYSIEGILAFTTLPLQISTVMGIIFSIMAFIMLIFVIARKLMFSDPVAGWTSTICVILFLGGIQLFSIGILGRYIEKIYLESKNRPIYIIEETNID